MQAKGNSNNHEVSKPKRGNSYNQGNSKPAPNNLGSGFNALATLSDTDNQDVDTTILETSVQLAPGLTFTSGSQERSSYAAGHAKKAASKPRNKTGSFILSTEPRPKNQDYRPKATMMSNSNKAQASSSGVSATEACTRDVPSASSCNPCTANPAQTEPPSSSLIFPVSLISNPSTKIDNFTFAIGEGNNKNVEMSSTSISLVTSNMDQHSSQLVASPTTRMTLDLNNQDANAAMEEDSSLNQSS